MLRRSDVCARPRHEPCRAARARCVKTIEGSQRGAIENTFLLHGNICVIRYSAGDGIKLNPEV